MRNLLNRNLFIGFMILSSFSVFGIGERASFIIAKTSKDSTLKSGEAVFVFTFITPHYEGTKNGKQEIYSSLPIKGTFEFSYNGKQSTILSDSSGKFILKVKPGKYKFQFFYNENFFEVITDSITIKPAFKTEANVILLQSHSQEVSLKPVIYIYPEKTTSINLTLELDGKLDFTYPKYENGWKFIADSNGTISMNNKKYPYLYWDGPTNINKSKINWQQGFIVSKENLVNFFEEKLSSMGLNSKEIEDYITFWCPLMNANEKNYVHFVFNEEYNQFAKLSVTPKPQNIFRVYMIWSKADEKMNSRLTEQKIPSFTRKGFTVLEWGGAESKTIFQ